MLFKSLGHIWNRSLLYRFAHTHICKMNKAYLRHLPEDSKFELTFHYINPELKINRQFNFSRQSSETVPNFLQRIGANVDKIVKKKNKKDGETVNVTLFLNDNLLENDVNLQCGEVFQRDNRVVLDVASTKYEVLIDSPWIYTLGLPDCILADFLVYPTKFDSVNTNKQLSDYTWSKSKDKNHWTVVGSAFLYKPCNDDIDYYLKLTCTPKNSDCEGPALETVSSVTVSASPGVCPFEERHLFTTEPCTNSTIRIVTYNILADLYCDSDYTRTVLHPYCPAYALALDYRKQLFVKELLGYNSDILCLQEVDRKVYKYDLSILFERLDFAGDYCIKGGETAEGLACFYNRKRFRCLDTKRVLLSQELDKNPVYEHIWTRIVLNEKLKLRILDRSTVLQVNVLECLDVPDRIVLVANTHLYFHPDSDHIRLLQGAFIIKYLEDLLGTLRQEFQSKKVSLLICGDFNSTPECGIYQLYTTGKVPETHIDFQSKLEEACTGLNLEQSVRMSSACGTPQYTNFTAGFAACLDYIFYEVQAFEVVKSVPMPSLEQLQQFTALPSIYFPSDHLSLVSDLKLL